jgi:hypothetical protein
MIFSLEPYWDNPWSLAKKLKEDLRSIWKFLLLNERCLPCARQVPDLAGSSRFPVGSGDPTGTKNAFEARFTVSTLVSMLEVGFRSSLFSSSQLRLSSFDSSTDVPVWASPTSNQMREVMNGKSSTFSFIC